MPISSASSGLSGVKLVSATTVAAAMATGGATGASAASAALVPPWKAPAIACPRTSPPAASGMPSAITDHRGTSGKCWKQIAIATQKGDQNPASPMPLRAIVATRTRSGSGASRSWMGARIACAPTTSTAPMTLAPNSVAASRWRGSSGAISRRVRGVSGRCSAVVRRTTRVTKKAAKVVTSPSPAHSAPQAPSRAARTSAARASAAASARVWRRSPAKPMANRTAIAKVAASPTGASRHRMRMSTSAQTKTKRRAIGDARPSRDATDTMAAFREWRAGWGKEYRMRIRAARPRGRCESVPGISPHRGRAPKYPPAMREADDPVPVEPAPRPPHVVADGFPSPGRARHRPDAERPGGGRARRVSGLIVSAAHDPALLPDSPERRPAATAGRTVCGRFPAHATTDLPR